MSQDFLQNLLKNPQDIFKLRSPQSGETKSNVNLFNELTKSIISPLVSKYSVLDEVYIDGLDSTQVFGQTKIVLDGIGKRLLRDEIPKMRAQIGEVEDEEGDEEEEDEEEEEGEGGEEEEEEVVVKGGEEEEEVAEEEEEVEEEVAEEEEEVEEEEEEEDEEEEEEEEEEENEKLGTDSEENELDHKKDAFGLNDGFFDIDQYKKHVLALENEEDSGNASEEIDYFASLSGESEDDEEEEQMDYYDDFYEKPGNRKGKKQQSKESEEGEGEGEEIEDFADEDYEKAIDSVRLDLFAEEEDKDEGKKTSENLSTFEKQQRELQKEIAKLEAELIAEKKWTLKGEVTSNERPKESLLEENEITFDRTAKPVPTITQEVTETIEDLIRKRIKNDDFNDLPRRIIQDLSKFHKGPQVEVSEQKSARSLAELYEDEYNQVDAQRDALNEEEKKQHEEISELFTMVTHKLDALCSAHFIPKPHQVKDIEIKVTDASAPLISMEDAQPLNVSSESRLAPQEIYKIGDDAAVAATAKGFSDDPRSQWKSEVQFKSGLSYSKSEINRDEKQRLRRANKRKKMKNFKQREEFKRQRTLQEPKSDGEKKIKNNQVTDTLSKAKNVTIIGKKGELRDIQGNLKRTIASQTPTNFKL